MRACIQIAQNPAADSRKKGIGGKRTLAGGAWEGGTLRILFSSSSIASIQSHSPSLSLFPNATHKNSGREAATAAKTQIKGNKEKGGGRREKERGRGRRKQNAFFYLSGFSFSPWYTQKLTVRMKTDSELLYLTGFFKQ